MTLVARKENPVPSCKGGWLMTPSEQLKEEHEEILLMLKILEKVCARMEAKEGVDLGHMERILEFQDFRR
jgi:hemerythrin-like domain-containing protein